MRLVYSQPLLELHSSPDMLLFSLLILVRVNRPCPSMLSVSLLFEDPRRRVELWTRHHSHSAARGRFLVGMPICSADGQNGREYIPAWLAATMTFL